MATCGVQSPLVAGDRRTSTGFKVGELGRCRYELYVRESLDAGVADVAAGASRKRRGQRYPEHWRTTETAPRCRASAALASSLARVNPLTVPAE